MKILIVTGFLALVLLVAAVIAGPPIQNWDDEKTFWTKNSVKLLNERLDRFEKRLAKAERPRRTVNTYPGVRDGEPIRPRRPLSLLERARSIDSLVYRLERLEVHHLPLFHIWKEQLEVINGKTEALEEANQ